MKNELEDANRRFNMSQTEVARAAEDLQLMTKENQAITSELAGMCNSCLHLVYNMIN